MSDSKPPAAPAAKLPDGFAPIAHLLQFFASAHLPPDLAAVSSPCADLARLMATSLPASPEVTAGLRKLLEAKDCFVRAAMLARQTPA